MQRLIEWCGRQLGLKPKEWKAKRVLRHVNHLTKVLGVCADTLRHLLKGKRYPEIHTRLRILEVTGLPMKGWGQRPTVGWKHTKYRRLNKSYQTISITGWRPARDSIWRGVCRVCGKEAEYGEEVLYRATTTTRRLLCTEHEPPAATHGRRYKSYLDLVARTKVSKVGEPLAPTGEVFIWALRVLLRCPATPAPITSKRAWRYKKKHPIRHVIPSWGWDRAIEFVSNMEFEHE